MAYLNPQCADCMSRNGQMWKQYCRARLAVNNCPNGYWARGERDIVRVQDTQKMPRDNRGNVKLRLDYTNVEYY